MVMHATSGISEHHQLHLVWGSNQSLKNGQPVTQNQPLSIPPTLEEHTPIQRTKCKLKASPTSKPGAAQHYKQNLDMGSQRPFARVACLRHTCLT